MKLEPPRALLFDWDNTLVDTWVVIHHALEVTLKAMGQQPWTLEETRERVRASARDSFSVLFGERAEEAGPDEFGTTQLRYHVLSCEALVELVATTLGSGTELSMRLVAAKSARC